MAARVFLDEGKTMIRVEFLEAGRVYIGKTGQRRELVHIMTHLVKYMVISYGPSFQEHRHKKYKAYFMERSRFAQWVEMVEIDKKRRIMYSGEKMASRLTPCAKPVI